jgi:predicted RNase H-like nuclease (RuvC/YqgF family)
MFAIEELGKQLAIKIISITAVITIVLGFGTYKYVQFKEEEVKEKCNEQLTAQRKAHDEEVQKINKVNAESLEKQKAIMDEYKKQLDSIQLDYEQKVKELVDLRATKIKELTKNINKEPEVVLDDLAHKFGFEVVKVEDE